VGPMLFSAIRWPAVAVLGGSIWLSGAPQDEETPRHGWWTQRLGAKGPTVTRTPPPPVPPLCPPAPPRSPVRQSRYS
jgi:hypothetical protein